MPEFESLLDQYKLYVEDDFVDFELKNVSTKSTKISNIPSLLDRKYVYPVNETEYQKLSYNFFNNINLIRIIFYFKINFIIIKKTCIEIFFSRFIILVYFHSRFNIHKYFNFKTNLSKVVKGLIL